MEATDSIVNLVFVYTKMVYSPEHCFCAGVSVGRDFVTTQDQTPEVDKRRALSQAVANAVAGGARVESQSDDQAIMVKTGPDILKYALLTVITVGVYWLGGWFFYRPKKEKRTIIRIDDLGNTLIQDV